MPPQKLCPLGQIPPHDVPLHVAVPPSGAGQGTQAPPQLLTEVLLTHVPLQLCVLLGQAHTPAWQVIPPVHAAPHAPQLTLLDCRSTHEPPHNVGIVEGHPVAQAYVVAASGAWASPEGTQTGSLLGQATPHAPQLVAAARLVLHPVPASAQSA
jgi:hypothetical protein